MGIGEALRSSIKKVGIKEVARRSNLSASTISRVSTAQINPSLEVVEKISNAIGYVLLLQPNIKQVSAPRLLFAEDILGRMRNELKKLGVRHVIIFGSVARGEDKNDSDIDIYLDFGDANINVTKMLKAEGRILESFEKNKVDIVSRLSSAKGQRLKQKIDQEGIRVF